MKDRIINTEDISITSPCTEDFSYLEGGDKIKFCRFCNKNVYQIKGMTQKEFDDLQKQNPDGLCIAFPKRNKKSFNLKHFFLVPFNMVLAFLIMLFSPSTVESSSDNNSQIRLNSWTEPDSIEVEWGARGGRTNGGVILDATVDDLELQEENKLPTINPASKKEN